MFRTYVALMAWGVLLSGVVLLRCAQVVCSVLLLEKNVCTPTLVGSKAAAQRPFDRGPPMRPKMAMLSLQRLSIQALPASRPRASALAGVLTKEYVSLMFSMRIDAENQNGFPRPSLLCAALLAIK